MWRFLFCVLTCIVAGCAGGADEPSAPRALPGPATFRVTGTLRGNLTPELMAATGLPQNITCTLDASAESVAIAAEPLRSRHEGRMKLTLIGDPAAPPLAEMDITIEGMSDGGPNRGLGDALSRFLEAASLLATPLRDAPGTRPANGQ